MSQRHLGPVVGATLLASDINYASQAYQKGLGFNLVRQGQVSSTLCELWGTASLLGASMHILAAANGEAWLRIIEDADCVPHKPLMTHGWMSLEVSVKDVDTIRREIDLQYFEIIGEPAYLQVSDAIKAMQVIGPTNEVSYITQVDKPVPPFELPMTEAKTGSLFIPVLCTPDRDKSLAFYESLNKAEPGIMFDTKVTVLNKAWGNPIEHQYSVATLQLAGSCLFEIDQVPKAQPVINNLGSLPSGIAMITCVAKNLSAVAEQCGRKIMRIDDNYYPGSKVALLKGPAGEWIELVETK